MVDKAQDQQEHGRAALLELLKKYDTAILTTVSPDGSLHSRPMGMQKAEPDMDIWFASGLDSSKVRDLEADPRVNLAFYDTPGKGYVSVSGRVRLNRDRKRIAELWEPSWKLWFPDGKDDPDITLLVVEPEQAEYIDPATNKLVLLQAVARAVIGGESPHGEDIVHLDKAELQD